MMVPWNLRIYHIPNSLIILYAININWDYE